MAFHMTQTMLDLVGAAIDRLDGENRWAEIEKMGGYFVTHHDSKVPASAAVIAIVKKHGVKYKVCVRIVDRLDALDDDQWQKPWEIKDSR